MGGMGGYLNMFKPNPLPVFYFSVYGDLYRVVDYYWYFCFSDLRRVCLGRHVSLVTSPNGKWARCSPWLLLGCGAVGSRTKTTPPLHFFLLLFAADHGRVSDGTQARSSADAPPPFFASLPSPLAFPWWLNRTCASLWRQALFSRLLLFTCSPQRLPPSKHLELLTHSPTGRCARRPVSLVFCGLFVWFCLAESVASEE